MGILRDVFYRSPNPLAYLTSLGYVFNLSEVALATAVTGPTTFATTTPSFIVNNAAASGMTVIPLYFSFQQSGTVAGGAVTITMEVDNAARYSSGGTAVTAQNAWVNGGINNSALPSGVTAFSGSGGAITATNAAGVRIWSPLVGQDVSSAEGVTNELVWTPPTGAPELLTATSVLGASWLVHAVAAVTGVTFLWAAKVAVIPNSEL